MDRKQIALSWMRKIQKEYNFAYICLNKLCDFINGKTNDLPHPEKTYIDYSI